MCGRKLASSGLVGSFSGVSCVKDGVQRILCMKRTCRRRWEGKGESESEWGHAQAGPRARMQAMRQLEGLRLLDGDTPRRLVASCAALCIASGTRARSLRVQLL